MGHTLSSSASRRLIALVLGAALGLLSSLAVTLPANADTRPPSPATPVTASADSLPTAQVNGVVWDQVIVGDTVYAGGNFTSARPAGSPSGTGEVPRSFLLSYRLSTGELTAWAPVLDGQVRALAASPDGARVYAVGEFTSVDGQTRNRIVGFDSATGAVLSSFAASSNAALYAVAASNSTVYTAGNITAASGVSRPGTAAAFSASNGAPTAWAPVITGGRAFAMVVSPDDSKVVIAGNFTGVDGSSNPGYGLAAVDTATGSLQPFAIASTVRNAGTDAAIYNLDSDGTYVYGTGYTFGGGGNLEGAWKATWADGAIQWINNCAGDEYSIATGAGAVYIAGHSHDCSKMGDFPQTNPWTWYRALALSPDAAQTLLSGNFAGKPAPSVLDFYPSLNAGTFTGQGQGPWSVAANANYVVYAGEFTKVNGELQQGLSRFAVSAIAPNQEGPTLSGSNWTPGGSSYGAGSALLTWTANWDRDNELLSYRILRDGVVVNSIPATSRFWDRPTLNFLDTGLVPGSPHSYRVQAVDPWGNTASSAPITLVAGAPGSPLTSSYASTIMADQPNLYYRMGGASGPESNQVGSTANTTQAGNVTQQLPLSTGSAVVRGAPGAIAGDSDTGMQFVGSNSSRAYQTVQTWSDESFAVEAWFKTTSSSGKIVGFGSSASASNSSSYDRQLYLNGGRIYWGVYDSAQRTLQSPAATYNDGKWHQVVGVLGPRGMTLYVDGQAVASRTDVVSASRYWGAWRVGGDSTWAGNQNFTGSIDEVAVYGAPVSAERILQHYQVGTGAGAVNVPPTARYTSSSTFLTAQLDGSASGDADGSLVSYAWDFGDGTTGSGASVSHTYAAAGSYPVKLTVTDNSGASASTTSTVTVTSQPPAAGGATIASDAFERTTTSGWGSASAGGAWTTAGGTSYSVSSGTGRFGHSAGSTRRASLTGVSQVSTVTDVKVSLDKAVAGGSVFAGAVARQIGSDYYLGRLRYNTDGTVGLQLLRGSGTVLANLSSTGLTATPGQPIELKVSATGTSPTTLSAKAWATGSPEPTGSQLTTTDSTPGLQGPGYIGLESYVSSAATNAPLVVSYDDYAVTAPNAPPTAAFTAVGGVLSASADATASSDPDGSITAYSWSFGDGETGTGATATHSYATAGTYAITLTVTDNGGATSTASSNVVVTRPANQPPAASFTTSTTVDSVAVDATASSDPDGTITAYAWDFGDGATATGATATHAYGTPGTYTVALTVTDDQGATASTTRRVTVAARPPVLASDSFSRDVAAGWGTADAGGNWTAAATSNYFISGGSAAAVHGAGSTRRATLNGVSSTSTNAVVTISLDRAATGGGAYAGIVGRQVGAAYYQARLRFNADGTLGLQILNGSTVLTSTTLNGITAAPGQLLRLRMLTSGSAPTTLSARAWLATAAEPTGWQLTVTDSATALQAAGTVGVESYLSASATGVPLTVRYDDLVVTTT